jgi:dUTP pyrophosphatase
MIRLETIEGAKTPTIATKGSAGIDMYAFESVVIKPLQRVKIRLGVRIKSMPHACFMDLRIRSGIAINKGLALINGAAVIDSDYEDEICALIINLSEQEQIIERGDKIVQGIIIESVSSHLMVSVDGGLLDRGGVRSGGFGSTGV